MKKLFVGILIFAVISIGVTGALIKFENSKENVETPPDISFDISGEENKTESNIDVSKEKTLNLYGTYDENDLVVEDVEEKIQFSNSTTTINIPVIKGLKDKSVEEKINSDIRKRVIEKAKEVLQKGNVSITKTYTQTEYNYSNFSNVISYEWRVSYGIANEDSYNREIVVLNYELINGERLKFEDLFLASTDLHSIVRRMFYREAARDTVGGDSGGSVYYDQETGKWVQDGWDFITGEEETIEYNPYLTEYDIAKKINKFIKNEQKVFYFTPSRVYIVDDGDDYSYFLYFKDIADEVVIYDKYLTQESIYEASNIGSKNLWTCSEVTSNNQYIKYGFAADNLYYDISLARYSNLEEGNQLLVANLGKVKNELIKSANNKLEDYKKIAKENPNKFFVLSINPYYTVNESDDGNQIIASMEEYLSSTDIKNKEEVMDEILASYRYYNLAFYRSALDYAGYLSGNTESKYYKGKIVFDNFKIKSEEKTYNVFQDAFDYIIPNSDMITIEKSEIQNLSKEDLNRAYNEIFARHGHDFKNKELKEYFESCSWYTPTSNKTVTLDELSEIEKYNLDIIKSVIAEKK